MMRLRQTFFDWKCARGSYVFSQMPLAHVAVAFESLEQTHPDSPALMVIQSLLGSFDASVSSAINSSSKMVNTLAGYNDRQYPLVNSAMTFNTQYRCAPLMQSFT
jgi:mitochondrial-processing peptidase subunit beta